MHGKLLEFLLDVTVVNLLLPYSITNSVQEVTQKVELVESSDGSYSSYDNAQSDIAMAVVESSASARATGGILNPVSIC